MQRENESQSSKEALDDIMRESLKRIDYIHGLTTWNLGQLCPINTIGELDGQKKAKVSSEKIEKCIKLAFDANNALKNITVLLENEISSDGNCDIPDVEMKTINCSNLNKSQEDDKKEVIDLRKVGFDSSDWVGSNGTERSHEVISLPDNHIDVESSFSDSTYCTVLHEVRVISQAGIVFLLLLSIRKINISEQKSIVVPQGR